MNSEGEQVTETGGSETTETTETTDSTETTENDEDSPAEDLTEQVIIEEDFEFMAGVWYRVVIEFQLSKIRVYVNEEFMVGMPELDDEPLSRTTMSIELEKSGFREIF